MRRLPMQSAPEVCGLVEAVFSSSEDRIRANQASAGVAGSPVVASRIVLLARTAAESLFTVLFPSDCRICGEPLTNISRLPVCPDCLAHMHPVSGRLCSVCGERVLSPYAGDRNEPLVCPVCRRLQPPFAAAVAYGSYEEGLRELIHLLKYCGVRPAANVLGRMLAEAVAHLELADELQQVVVIPVPLHKSKWRQRGFNQAELIAQAAMKVIARPDRFVLMNDVLQRQRETQSQIGLTSHQRRENMRGAFAVTKAGAVKGRDVLIVDDVYTTGTTASECARVLRRAGAARVCVATVARTLKLASKYAELEPEVSEETQAADEIELARAAV